MIKNEYIIFIFNLPCTRGIAKVNSYNLTIVTIYPFFSFASPPQATNFISLYKNFYLLIKIYRVLKKMLSMITFLKRCN